ncbi:isoprenylcysteine carboxylmethyltransferase family protein [Aureimonas sp. ME7]|uniref:methyltransferase family protein n=1 Tax=Aureimonas sp. ME7 TaxID=2744252 RepID=UPI0015F3E15C|nr:isoprenylcysteine carboxylmethyltransferase family protein [Aureimonas sp. ME7]
METVDLHKVQQNRKHALRLSGLGLLALTLLSAPVLPDHAPVENALELVGLGMIALGILGRAWCSLYIGGRKKTEIVSAGPYSISRNPLYMFSFVAVAGVGAQSGSLVLTGLFLAVAAAVFRVVIAREERFLSDRFGARYEAYKARTPRFGPRFSAWRDQATVEIRPRLVVRTLLDGSAFLLAWPFFELLEDVRAAGILDPLVILP